MVKIKYRYIVGTHIMFYEIEMAKEHIQSIVNAVNEVENKENITVDLFFNLSEYFERVNTNQITHPQLKDKFNELVKMVEETGAAVNPTIYDDFDPISMVDYRRDLNYNGCKNHDYVIWGETDCLLPKEMFTTLESIFSPCTDSAPVSHLKVGIARSNVFFCVFCLGPAPLYQGSGIALEA